MELDKALARARQVRDTYPDGVGERALPVLLAEIERLQEIKAAAVEFLNALSEDGEWDHLIVEQRTIDAVSALSRLVRTPAERQA